MYISFYNAMLFLITIQMFLQTKKREREINKAFTKHKSKTISECFAIYIDYFFNSISKSSKDFKVSKPVSIELCFWY